MTVKAVLITNGKGIFKRWDPTRTPPAGWYRHNLKADKVVVPVVTDLGKKELMESLKKAGVPRNSSMPVEHLRTLLRDHYEATAIDKNQAAAIVADEVDALEDARTKIIFELESIGIPFNGEDPTSALEELLNASQDTGE